MIMVSVIIPVYNRAAYIGRAIESVLEQTYRDFEIIVVDDGSTDNTKEALKPYDDKIRYIYQENQGASGARNAGIKIAEGKYIAFLDSDDIWLPEKLEKQMELFQKSSKKLGVVYCGVSYVDNKTGQITKTIVPDYKGNVSDIILKRGSGPTTSASVVKKECLKSAGLFDERLFSYEDTDLWIRISQSYKFDYIKDSLVKFLRNHEQLSTNEQVFLKGRELFLSKYSNILPRITKCKLYYMIGNAYCFMNNANKGRKNLLLSIISCPLFFKSYLCLFISLFGSKVYRSIREKKQANSLII